MAGKGMLDQRRVDQRSDDERKADTESGTRSPDGRSS